MGMEGIGDKLRKRDETSIILDKPIAQGPEALNPAFEKAIEKGIKDALTRVKTRFEDAENPLDNLEYHSTKHTKDVMRRAGLILRAMTKGDARLIRLGEFIAANHDTVQKYDVVEADGKKMRKRHIEKNEEASAEEAIAYLETIDPGLVSAHDKYLVEQAIRATIPGFVVNKEEGYATVVQKNLNEQSDLLVRAVALADLGTAGMDDPETFVLEGDAIFREENLDIAEALQDPAAITDEKKQAFIKRMLAWSDSQYAFARGRKALLDKELAGLPEEAQEAVRALFTQFDDSIHRAQAKTDMRKTMAFEELVRDFGYKI